MIGSVAYPGGKGKCFQHIINALPKHSVYIETHLGGGAVLLNKLPAELSIGIDIDPDVIRWWRVHHPSVATYVHGDALEFLRKYPFTGSEVVYCDPPYLPSTRKRTRVYKHELNEQQHVELLNTLKCLSCSVALSGYQSALYCSGLRSWNEIRFRTKAHDSVRIESLWTNFAPPAELHDSRFLGDSFHQRQDIKRRFTRLQQRIVHLSVPEQYALASWLREQLDQRTSPEGAACNVSST